MSRHEEDPTEVSTYDQRLADARAHDAETDTGLRRWLGFGTLALMAIQFVIADAVFVVWGWTNGWEMPVAAINVWLGTAVVQVVALAHTVARYLFPASGRTA